MSLFIECHILGSPPQKLLTQVMDGSPSLSFLFVCTHSADAVCWSSWAISWWPSSVAQVRAVLPVVMISPFFAPAARRSFTTSTRPLREACIKGVQPRLLALFTSAFTASNAFTHSTWPLIEAILNAVWQEVLALRRGESSRSPHDHTEQQDSMDCSHRCQSYSYLLPLQAVLSRYRGVPSERHM